MLRSQRPESACRPWSRRDALLSLRIPPDYHPIGGSVEFGVAGIRQNIAIVPPRVGKLMLAVFIA